LDVGQYLVDASFRRFRQPILVCCEYVYMCRERRGPVHLVTGHARDSLGLAIRDERRVGVQLDDGWVCQELPVGAAEFDPGVGYGFNGGDLLLGLTSGCDGSVEVCLDGVGEGG
jgi:hypothetical protein